MLVEATLLASSFNRASAARSLYQLCIPLQNEIQTTRAVRMLAVYDGLISNSESRERYKRGTSLLRQGPKRGTGLIMAQYLCGVISYTRWKLFRGPLQNTIDAVVLSSWSCSTIQPAGTAQALASDFYLLVRNGERSANSNVCFLAPGSQVHALILQSQPS